VPGCPSHPDNLAETILYLLYQVADQAPMIPWDAHLRPQWLFGITVHEGCDRAGYYEQGEFAETYDSPKCLVKLGCSGQFVTCNVPKRGRINGAGGCPNLGGICIDCTMPGFSDMFMPFIEQVPIAGRTGSAIGVKENETYDSVIRSLREFARKKFDTEPPWRKKGSELVIGYIPDWATIERSRSCHSPVKVSVTHPTPDPEARTAGKPVAIETRVLVAVWCRSVGTCGCRTGHPRRRPAASRASSRRA
jgi:hydrogenase small subunit